jgi:hypothetical protein
MHVAYTLMDHVVRAAKRITSRFGRELAKLKLLLLATAVDAVQNDSHETSIIPSCNARPAHASTLYCIRESQFFLLAAAVHTAVDAVQIDSHDTSTRSTM